jgi:hypothetical protein
MFKLRSQISLIKKPLTNTLKVSSLLSIILATNAVLAQDYYVANDGNDGNPGTIEKPWKTLKKISTASFTTGDDVYFKKGDTFSPDITLYPNWTGTSSNPAIIGAYGSGERPVFQFNSEGRYGFIVKNKQHFTIENLSLINQGIALMEANSKDYTVRNVKVKNSRGVSIFMSHVDGYLIEDCETDGAGNGGIGIWGSHGAQATNGIIRNNHTHHSKNNQGIVLHSSGDDGGVGPNHLILNNLSHHNEEQGLNADTGTYILMRGNTTYDNRGGGIGLGDSHHIMIDKHVSKHEGDWTASVNIGLGVGHNTGADSGNYRTVRRSLIIDPTSFGLRVHKGVKYIGLANNTVVYGGLHELEKYKDASMVQSAGTNVKVINNIIMSTNDDNGRTNRFTNLNTLNPASTNTYFDSNMYFRSDLKQDLFNYRNATFSDWQDVSQQDRDGSYQDPLLVNASSRIYEHQELPFNRNEGSSPVASNFMLENNSPAIDGGAPLTKTVDSGSGTKIKVGEAYLFFDGFNLTTGDTIVIGGNQPVVVEDVDYKNNILTVNESISWNIGEGVSLPYDGFASDVGAFESGIINNSDGDGLIDIDDALPTESVDTDSDGIGNNTNTGNDGDGSSDVVEIAAGSNPLIPNGGLTNSSSLIAHYTFDNISGVTVSDQSGNGNDAIRSGTNVVPGKVGTGLQFDGKSDYVASGAFDVAGSEITLSAWVKANGFGIHDARIISKATGTEEQDHYWMLSTMESNGSKLRFRLKTNGQTSTLISTRNIPVGKWVHVMASYDGSSMRLYLDGKESGSLSKTGDISPNPAAAIRVGDNPKTSARNFDGVIDDVRIYNRALSAVEIQQLLMVEEAQSEPVVEPGDTSSTANLILDNGFEKGGKFEKIGNNYFWDGFKKSGNYPTRGQAPQRSDKAGKFYLNKAGSGTTLGVKYRTEVTVDGDRGKFDFGKEYWISMDYRYENWDSDKYSEVGPLQLHTRGSDWSECSLVGSAHGTAPFLMDTKGNKARFITYGGKVLWEGVIQRKQWLNVIVNFKVSAGSDGFIEVWKDGVKLGRVNGPNSPLKDPCGKPMRTPFFKMGVYKYTWNPKHEGKYLTDVTERELWIDNLKIAEGANGFSLVSSASTSSSASVSAPDPKPIKAPTPSLEPDVGADNNVDRDGDGIPDLDDALPTDPTESVDTDGDGIGNNTDTDDDGDGYSDAVEIASGINPLIPNRRLINSSSLVTHYTFDNISGVTVSDQSGNGNHAIRSGTKIVPGKIGNGLQFDGKSDYVVSGAFDVVGSEITLSAWIKVNNFSIHDARIISKATGTAEQDHYWMLSTIKDDGSKLRFRLKANGQTATLIGTHNIPVGKWVHVMASYDGSSMRLYLDGKESGSMSKTGEISPNPAAAIRVGDNPKTSARNFDGVIDDVRIYNQALSVGEISDNAGGITPIPQSQPEPELQPQSANLIFDNGFEGGSDDWNGSGASWRKVPASAVVSVDAREGGKSVRFLPVSNQKRSEFVVNGNQGTFKWGEEYWVGFSINMQKHMVDEGPEDNRNYKIISQHHSVPRKGANGKPDWNLNGGPNGFTIRADDGLFKIFTTTKTENVDRVLPITGGAVTGAEVRYSHPYELNTWYDFVLHFRYAPDDSGIMEVFINGDKKIDVHGPTMYKYALVGKKDPLTPYPVSHIQYQKIGMYYGSGARNGEILYDAYRIGNKNASYVDVAPRGEGG